AIYGTRPWFRYGEGPRYRKEQNSGQSSEKEYYELKYSVNDVRYTTKNNVVYAILLGQPEPNNMVSLTSFVDKDMPPELKIAQIHLLGTGEKLHWNRKKTGLSITMPEKLGKAATATVLKIQLQ